MEGDCVPQSGTSRSAGKTGDGWKGWARPASADGGAPALWIEKKACSTFDGEAAKRQKLA